VLADLLHADAGVALGLVVDELGDQVEEQFPLLRAFSASPRMPA
jgi:hypothetical protein